MTDDQSHKRVNDILLGPLERPALQWLAANAPSWMTPDVLTLIGILGSVLIFVSYVLTNIDAGFLWLASLGFVINWFGDSLDGTVARYRKIERPKYGFFIDHTVDAFSQVLIFAGLGLTPYLSFNAAILALVGYLLMSILVYVNTYVTGVFKISYGRLGPTEVRAIAVLLNLGFFFLVIPSIQLPWGSVPVSDFIAYGIALLLFSIFTVNTIRRAKELAQADKTPVPNKI